MLCEFVQDNPTHVIKEIEAGLKIVNEYYIVEKENGAEEEHDCHLSENDGCVACEERFENVKVNGRGYLASLASEHGDEELANDIDRITGREEKEKQMKKKIIKQLESVNNE